MTSVLRKDMTSEEFKKKEAFKKKHFFHHIASSAEPTGFLEVVKAGCVVFPGPYVVSLKLSLGDVQPEDLAMTIN